MKWVLVNLLGAVAWVFGLFVAKGATLPSGNLLAATDHQFVTGVVFGLAGLATLLWTNLRSTT